MAMVKDVPNVMSVRIRRQALLLVHCVQQVNRNPTQDNRVVLIVWLGRLAMENFVPNVLSVHIHRKALLLVHCVCPVHHNPTQDNRVASIV